MGPVLAHFASIELKMVKMAGIQLFMLLMATAKALQQVVYRLTGKLVPLTEEYAPFNLT